MKRQVNYKHYLFFHFFSFTSSRPFSLKKKRARKSKTHLTSKLNDCMIVYIVPLIYNRIHWRQPKNVLNYIFYCGDRTFWLEKEKKQQHHIIKAMNKRIHTNTNTKTINFPFFMLWITFLESLEINRWFYWYQNNKILEMVNIFFFFFESLSASREKYFFRILNMRRSW